MRKWLIRTNNNQIFGPVTKEKILEFYRDKTLTLEDEVCSGNGYWFYLREEELIQKYLIGNIDQPFNPISEAKDVLDFTSDIENQIGDRRKAPEPVATGELTEDGQQTFIPSADDLAFPDEEEQEESDDITVMKNLSSDLLDLRQDTELEPKNPSSTQSMYQKELGKGLELNIEDEDYDDEVHYPADEDLAYPDLGEGESSQGSSGYEVKEAITKEELNKRRKINVKPQGKPVSSKTQGKPSNDRVKQKDDRYLLFLFLILLLALGFTVYRKLSVVQDLFSINKVSIFPIAQAQTIDPSKKKVRILSSTPLR